MPLMPSSQPRITSPKPRRNLMIPLSKRAPVLANRPSYRTCTTFDRAAAGPFPLFRTSYWRPELSVLRVSAGAGFSSLAFLLEVAAGDPAAGALAATAGFGLGAVATGSAPLDFSFDAGPVDCAAALVAEAAPLPAAGGADAAGADEAATDAVFAVATAAPDSTLAAFLGGSSSDSLSASGESVFNTPTRSRSPPSHVKLTSSSKRPRTWQCGLAGASLPSASFGFPLTEQYSVDVAESLDAMQQA
mmetsp:Transcript_68864/g.222582  ORF Transcript_68864/g.222582 Transcript_68864/m.222582 type:complete len:246 (-) Transcript_68864:138-875(-)